MNTNKIIEEKQFHIKKKYGQNFLTDKKILEKIVNSAELNKEIGVIEIGPGLGALTRYLCANSKHVLAYEIDSDLIPILKENLAEFDNLTLINKDVLEVEVKEDIKKYLKDCKEIYVVANLPYYVTTPIMTHLLQSIKAKKYVLMMQMEVCDKLINITDIKDYNALYISIKYQATMKELFKVPRTVFKPMPNVDSAVLEIKALDSIEHKPQNESFFFDVVSSSFQQRRKTLINNLMARFGNEREKIANILKELGLKENVRSEELSIDQFVDLSDKVLHAFMSDELVDLFDKDGKPLNIKIKRNELGKPNTYIKITSGIVKYNGLYFIQKRSPYKVISPSIYELPGGAMDSGETEVEGLIREIKEETNLDIKNIKFIKRVTGNYVIRYVFICEAVNDNVILEEAVEYKWVKKDDLRGLKLFKKHPDLLDFIDD